MPSGQKNGGTGPRPTRSRQTPGSDPRDREPHAVRGACDLFALPLSGLPALPTPARCTVSEHVHGARYERDRGSLAAEGGERERCGP